MSLLGAEVLAAFILPLPPKPRCLLNPAIMNTVFFPMLALHGAPGRSALPQRASGILHTYNFLELHM